MPLFMRIPAAMLLCALFAGCAASKAETYGPEPRLYKEMVTAEALRTFGPGKFVRNMIVYPPAQGSMPGNNEDIYGYTGRASLSRLTDAGMVRESWCYFIHKDTVLAFSPADEAEWCKK